MVFSVSFVLSCVVWAALLPLAAVALWPGTMSHCHVGAVCNLVTTATFGCSTLERSLP